MKPDLIKERGTLDGIEAFMLVAELRSFTAAAKALGVTPSAISQTIRSLEARVGVPLLMRTTRSVGLTQAGEQFLEHARPAVDNMHEAFEAARTLGERPAGRLRINMARSVVQPLFEPLLAGFFDSYPEIELEIYADDGFVDLINGGFDAGIRLAEDLAADVVAVRITDPFDFVTVGRPDYFDRHGRPLGIADLRLHRCVRFRSGPGALRNWYLCDNGRDVEVPVTGPIIVNDASAALVAVRAGVALGQVPQPLIQDEVDNGTLEIVLPEFASKTDGLFLYYPHRRQIMPKLRAFIDYVKDNLPETIKARSTNQA